MRPILCGTETEYGLTVEGLGASDQVEFATQFVRGYPHTGSDRVAYLGWDYRLESPRADLRGFKLKALAFDPEDAQYDKGKVYGSSEEIRSDRILDNGARFYNDHGHPEYSTPERFSIFEVAQDDLEGETVMLEAVRAFAQTTGKEVRAYKNNTDFHGASYGTHESYLVPRAHGFDHLFQAVTPMLLVRQLLTGAGKVGAESGAKCAYQISQRADFFMEPANAETLYRRPIFNTRDEPHADAAQWIRLHVISCDANRQPLCVALRLGLVKLALHLLDAGVAPKFDFTDVVQAFKTLSRNPNLDESIPLKGRSHTTVRAIFDSYFSAAEAHLNLEDPHEGAQIRWTIDTSRALLHAFENNPPAFAKQVDWAIKREVLQQVCEAEGWEWGDPRLASFDLEFANIDPEESLYEAMRMMEAVDEPTFPTLPVKASRAVARAVVVQQFRPFVKALGWSGVTFRIDGKEEFLAFPPDIAYPSTLSDVPDVITFRDRIKELSL